MKLSKLLDRAAELLSPEQRAREIKRKKLKTLLEDMKRHERELDSQLQDESGDPDKAGIALKRRILHEQRKKGVALLKQLKSEK